MLTPGCVVNEKKKKNTTNETRNSMSKKFVWSSNWEKSSVVVFSRDDVISYLLYCSHTRPKDNSVYGPATTCTGDPS